MKMDGKTVLITGSTDGVGRYVAAKLDRHELRFG
jgi:NAD(P)-dependent dehydrogenase (short-subunit alcohol dehydrogenase family)